MNSFPSPAADHQRLAAGPAAGAERPALSAVIPVFNEEPNLAELHRRSVLALDSTRKSWELIYVDDGSSDKSLEMLVGFTRDDRRIRVVEFNRNYGQHAAVFAGLGASRGDIVVTLDADLQNPPEEIPRLVAKMEEGYDVVGTRRKDRQDPLLRRLGSRIVNRLAGGGMTDYGCMLRAYSRRVVEQLGQCQEVSSFIPILANLFARRVAEIEVQHAARRAGSSKYGLAKLINLQFDLMTGFSAFLLRLMTYFGGLVALSAFALGGFLLVMRIIKGSEWAQFGVFTLFAVLFMMIGMLFMCLGVLGEYLGRIYTEVRNRPRYVISRIHGEGCG